MKNTMFYTDLKKRDCSVSVALADPKLFKKVPDDWHIVITDIQGSTEAVKMGLSEMVNLIATGSIVAALNIASEAKIDIPFFFGGDGATLLIPSKLLKKIMIALTMFQKHVSDKFEIDLRVGSYKVAKVFKAKKDLKIAKIRLNKLYAIPIVLGQGIHFAENIIKTNYIAVKTEGAVNTKLQLEGMECRWNHISTPNTTDEVLCLLIDSIIESEQATVFKRVLDKIDSIYGPHHKRNPISVPKLKLSLKFKKMQTELRMRKINPSVLDYVKDWTQTFIGKVWYMKSKPGKEYLKHLVQLSDIFVLDGRINMVISGSSKKREKLLFFLEKEEQMGRLIFGNHISKESIMTCYVRDMKEDHIHFVDAGKGGYTQAAAVLKAKMRD